jgi:Ni/Fe-hydrogenase subunit HybB-like protein
VSESGGPITQHRAERILAYMFISVIGVSIAAFIAVMIGTLVGAGADDGFSQGAWPVVLTLPLFGLPIAFLLLIALLIVNGIRRARASRTGSS